MSNANWIGFDEACASLIGLQTDLAERFVAEAVQGGGVTICDGAGLEFTWNNRPQAKSSWSSGHFVANSDFDVHSVDFGKPVISSAFSQSQSKAVANGLRDDWTFDRKALAAAVKYIGQAYSYVIAQDHLDRLDGKPTVANKALGGRPESQTVGDIKTLLGAYLGANGLPAGDAKAPAALISWCQEQCVKKGLQEPAKSTLEKLVAEVLGAHKEALGN